jgi:hypothetical protein
MFFRTRQQAGDPNHRGRAAFSCFAAEKGPPMSDGSADRLRHHIDRGRTHDKVDYPDPAAAPLGTDDEAGGATSATARYDKPPGRRGMAPRDGSPVLFYALTAVLVGTGLLLAVAG